MRKEYDKYNKKKYLENSYKFDEYNNKNISMIPPDKEMGKDEFIEWYKNSTPEKKRREQKEIKIKK